MLKTGLIAGQYSESNQEPFTQKNPILITSFVSDLWPIICYTLRFKFSTILENKNIVLEEISF
jgi:hypothetical protein